MFVAVFLKQVPLSKVVPSPAVSEALLKQDMHGWGGHLAAAQGSPIPVQGMFTVYSATARYIIPLQIPENVSRFSPPKPLFSTHKQKSRYLEQHREHLCQ